MQARDIFKFSHHFLAEASGFDFVKGETTSQPLLDVVFAGGASDHGPQGLEGPGGYAGSLGSTGLAPTFFAGGLVEPGLNVSVPIFVEVLVRHHLVAFGRHDEAVSLTGKKLNNLYLCYSHVSYRLKSY